MIEKKKYKALILDLDGTTIWHNSVKGMPSVKVVEAIEKARKKLFVGIATSRPYFSAKPIIDYLKLTGPCIVNSGAQIIDAPTGRIIKEQRLSYDDAKEVYVIAEKLNIPILLNTNERDVAFGEVEENDGNILGIWSYPAISEERAFSLIDKISHIPSITALKAPSSRNEKFYVIVSHVQATKQYGILETARYMGIDTHEIIGVGDGDNDFPLLMACGLRIAMGNAVDGLKEIADYIAPPVWEDGVVDVINKYVL
jgi:hypothetical protein